MHSSQLVLGVLKRPMMMMQLNIMKVMMVMKITLSSHTNAFFSACARYFKDDDDDAVEYNESDDDDEDHSHITYQCIFLSLC